MKDSAGTCRLLLPEHPLAGLQSRSALFGRWPTLCIDVPSIDVATSVEGRAAEILGPLPQAEFLENDDGSGTLRIPLPDLDPVVWHTLDAALRQDGHPVSLVPLVAPGALLARDLGDIDTQQVTSNGITATIYQRPDAPGIAPLDLAPVPLPSATRPLARDLVDALVAADPGFALAADDDAQGVVHRNTGRLGLRVGIPLPAFDDLAPEPEALTDLYDRAIAAVADVVQRHQDGEPALAPDLVIDPRWGLSILVWLVRPHAARLPGDEPVTAGVTVCPHVTDSPLVSGIEIQVLPDGPHEPVIDAVIALGRAGLPIRGAEPRWLEHDGRRHLAPTWRCDPEDLGAVTTAMADVDAAAIRIVPGPLGPLAETWYRIDPAWIVTPQLVVVRARDGATDRDWMPPVRPRYPTDADHDAQAALNGAMGAGWILRPVEADRDALRLDLPLGSLAAEVLHRAVRELGEVLAPRFVEPVAVLAWTRTGATLHLWCVETDQSAMQASAASTSAS